MNFYSIAEVAGKVGIHQSSLRRWEEWDLIFPQRVNMGRSTVRIYRDDDLEILRLAKKSMEDGMELRTAFDKAYADFAQQEGNKQ
jgi:DNA-binding transcriptional MerR regulator